MVVGITGCLFVIKSTATYGVSQVLTTYSLHAGNLSAAETASRLSPSDPEAHFSYGALLSFSGKPDQAVIELERAVALRPSDYGLWNELGLLRDQIGDAAGALQAFDEAVKLAPFYSQPRWNRGNVLLRSGQEEAAFKDLNQAAASNPSLLQNLVALAWGISKNDIQVAEQLAQIDSDERRIALARFLAWKGEGQQALKQYRKVNNVPEEIRRELIDQLLARNAFKEGFEIWKGNDAGDNQSTTAIYDGGFEGSLSFTDRGFGWRVARDTPAIAVTLDSSKPHSGAKSLRVEFNGNSNVADPLISQLILLEPSKRYKLSFASRSQEIVTGGSPFVVVTENSNGLKILGRSPPLEKGTGEWRTVSFEFATTPQTSGVLLILQRENCTTAPCPIFGAISLDSFSIEPLN